MKHFGTLPMDIGRGNDDSRGATVMLSDSKRGETSAAKPPRAGDGGEKDDDADDSSSSFLHPLFMGDGDGLPADFATNAGLAAIASLLGDGGDDQSDGGGEAVPPRPFRGRGVGTGVAQPLPVGGGKATSRHRRGKVSGGRHHPYSSSGDGAAPKKSAKDRTTTTIGEAQLFLNLWKI